MKFLCDLQHDLSTVVFAERRQFPEAGPAGLCGHRVVAAVEEERRFAIERAM